MAESRHAHQARERKEASRAIGRRANLRAGIGDRPHPLTALLARPEPLAEVVDRSGLARKQQGPAHATAGLHELGGRQVGAVDQQRRREIGEAAALVGAIVEHPRDTDRVRADRQVRTDLRAKLREQPRIGPRFARRGNAVGDHAITKRLVRRLEAAAQRIACADGAQRDQGRFLAEEHDARHRLDARGTQAASCSLSVIGVGNRPRGLEAQVGCQHFTGLPLDRQADAAGEEPDRRQRGDRNEQREHEHGEFAGLEIPQQVAQCERERRHRQFNSGRRVRLSRRMMRSQRSASCLSCVTSTSVVCVDAVEAEQQVHDLLAGRSVEVAGRLVGEQDVRFAHERARDGDALLLTARQLPRIVTDSLGETDATEDLPCCFTGIGATRELERQHHVFEGRE